MKEIITNNVFFGILLTYLSFEIGRVIFTKTQSPLFNPMLIGNIIVIFVLAFFNIPVDNYLRGGNIVVFFLGPATIALALPLYKKWDEFIKHMIPVITGAVIGSLVGVLSVIYVGKLLGIDKTLLFSLMPKSITTPIALELTGVLGGIPALTTISITLTGITGNVSAPLICKVFRIKHSVAKGIGIGVASHAVGTAKAMEMGEVEGSMSALSIVFAGLLTLIWAPLLRALV